MMQEEEDDQMNDLIIDSDLFRAALALPGSVKKVNFCQQTTL